MIRPSIAGFVVASVLGTTALVALAQDALLPLLPKPPAWWPATTDSPAVSEWYADLPWHQKLGTYAGNQIDEPIILPYKALPQADIDFCNANGMPEARRAECMIEVGVLNILGMYRIDTPYAAPPTVDGKTAEECEDRSLPCIQVMIRVANYYAKSSGGEVSLAARVFGDGRCKTDPWQPKLGCIYDGYTLSDGTTYAPQLPWYMSHYCDGMFTAAAGDFNDPVCYGDYLSTFNNGFSPLGGKYGDFEKWPRSGPWSVWPMQPTTLPPPDVPWAANTCKQGETACNIVLAGLALNPVTAVSTQYPYNNDLLLQWFTNAWQKFNTDQGDDYWRHFPWDAPGQVQWTDFTSQSALNPFLGTYDFIPTAVHNCNSTLTGKTTTNNDPKGCQDVNGNPIATATVTRAAQNLFPRQCNLTHLVSGDAATLRQCGLNYELHHNGWTDQWPDQQDWQMAMRDAAMATNQYGRTSFLIAGVPGMQLPVSFSKDKANEKGYSTYEQVYNTSIFSMYLPMANEADTLRQMPGRYYNDDFYHTLLMSNHNEADPHTFADGIRGKTLWHNEYRTHYMYDQAKKGDQHFPPEWFSAAFVVDNPKKALLPYHNNTCDGCHVRNGSGVPIKIGGKLDPVLQTWGMTTNDYNANVNNDYTFTGAVRPMKLVFFDLQKVNPRASASKYSTPLAFTPLTLLQPPRTEQASNLYYDNAIMNYYGDSFHVTGGNSYQWQYKQATAESQVVPASTKRTNPEKGQDYVPMYAAVSEFKTDPNCQLVSGKPPRQGWPKTCADVSGEAVAKAIQTQEVGYILLNGRRLGNSSAIEAMPDAAIKGFRSAQVAGAPGVAELGEAMAGEIAWAPGSRDGVLHPCNDSNRYTDCFIGRFGWLGDRASLEDQVANAAFVEMNMTSKQGYAKFYGANGKTTDPIRYAAPNCGPANKVCVESPDGNSDLTERDIERMADYSRWVGNPTRSEFQVTLPDVVNGEAVFRRLQCTTCHVIDKVSLDPLVNGSTINTMLPATYRNRLVKRAGNNFLSYIGTDLLMHDMGYLSQVGIVPANVKIRDADGVVFRQYQNYVQKIRTPALKGMRFNRYVTESYKNTKTPYDPTRDPSKDPKNVNAPACDFLLHDGRACDALEAAFLHDGPAVNKMGLIDKLSQLTKDDARRLRAFLYSL